MAASNEVADAMRILGNDQCRFFKAVALTRADKFVQAVQVAKLNLLDSQMPRYWQIKNCLLIADSTTDWYEAEDFTQLARKLFDHAVQYGAMRYHFSRESFSKLKLHLGQVEADQIMMQPSNEEPKEAASLRGPLETDILQLRSIETVSPEAAEGEEVEEESGQGEEHVEQAEQVHGMGAMEDEEEDVLAGCEAEDLDKVVRGVVSNTLSDPKRQIKGLRGDHADAEPGRNPAPEPEQASAGPQQANTQTLPLRQVERSTWYEKVAEWATDIVRYM